MDYSMGRMYEANTVVKCDHSDTHKMFITPRKHHRAPFWSNIQHDKRTLQHTRALTTATHYIPITLGTIGCLSTLSSKCPLEAALHQNTLW